ncbi:flagellar hook-basal body protein [Microbulbifer rhizosphaerae]|uniref:Flagellar basal body rod protein FlgG n=1 Tax=Microbulbifer rhizosphaerae TaxID=1562603 RepID=A0A7W4WFZ1_9GAMM|nr:flagellar hook basal-body protein [Microbulbifer rhizosphaerae]MBB3063483.1 flagellar basal body rod protein FlgG [Microbulbifer rhizosphaerae]
MIEGVSALLKSMQFDIEKLDIASQNLANIQTNGYKRIVDNIASTGAEVQDVENTTLAAKEGVPEVNKSVDFSQGSLKYTGRKLNIALEGDGFLQVRHGDNLLLTRRGELKVDQQGFLTLLNGAKLQGYEGDISLQPGSFEIDRQGYVYQEGGEPIAQLAIVNTSDLFPQGSGLYSSNIVEPLEVVSVRQGFLEASNVNHLQEMIKLVELTRHFESGHQVLQGYNTMMEDAVTRIGRI